ncbi:MAG: MerR family transcriptional regulator [Actinomycetia bacterium]|nr:MerR family transcriptional regulator [Actinomycetes bacterium]
MEAEGGNAALQEALFDDGLEPAGEPGYRGPEASAVVGISYRQLDYWARTDLVTPSIRPAEGSGTQRLYSFRDLLLLRVVKRLLDAGITLQQIRVAVAHLRGRGVRDLTTLTLLSDGRSVYECTSDNEIVDLLRGGQGMFAIALSGVWRDVEGSLATLQVEPQTAADGLDEFTQHRLRRAS